MTQNEYGDAFRAGFHTTLKFLISRGIGADAAEEAAQAGWCRGWEKITQLRDHQLVLTWVNSIAFNICRTNTRMDVRRLPLSERIASSTRVAETMELELALILDRCEGPHRALLLQVIQGLTASEIAGSIGVSEGAARLRMMRARRCVKEMLQVRS